MKAKMRKLIEHVKNDQEEAATALARMGGRKAEAALEIRGTADEARLAHEAEAALEVRGTAEPSSAGSRQRHLPQDQHQQQQKEPALWVAARAGDTEKCEQLLAAGAEVHT